MLISPSTASDRLPARLGTAYPHGRPETRTPTIFVLGERSPMPNSQGQQTAALLPMAEVQVVPAAGHLPWHERPGCVAAALARVRQLATT